MFMSTSTNVAALISTGCFQMTTVLKVNADGSGAINHRMVYTKAALAPLKQFRFLQAADIATYPDETLEQISDLDELRYLRILHMPKVADLSPLENLRRLVTVSLSTLPSWDASSKRTVVKSIAPE